VADNHPARIDALLRQQLKLGEPDRPAGCVRADGQAGQPVRAGRGAERPLLGSRDVMPVRADLADDAGPDAGVAHPLGDVPHDLSGDRVDAGPVEPGTVQVRIPVVPAAHHDRDAGCHGDPPQRVRIPADLVDGEVHQRAAARRPKRAEFGAGQVLVVEQAAAAVLPDQVDEDMLVRQHDAQVA
jgi:hypothetical protein